MTNRPAPYTQADVTRAIKGAVAAGVQVREVFCTAEGVRVVIHDNDDKPQRKNSFDEALGQ